MAFSNVSVTVKAKRPLSDLSDNDNVLPAPERSSDGEDCHDQDAAAAANPPKKMRTELQKQKRNVEKQPLRPPCDCKGKCREKVNQRRRISLWMDFWKKTYNDRKAVMWSLIERIPIQGSNNSTRSWHVKYNLIAEDGKKIKVCKTFFLATLGYPKTSSVIQELLKTDQAMLSPPPDKRGKSAPRHALTAEDIGLIQSHIKSYNPCISHYRRAHAPNRLYLPNEITEKEMHADFMRKHQNKQCSYETYSRQVRNLNISFVKLGEEQCELCMKLDVGVHDMEGGVCTMDCVLCDRKSRHKLEYELARKIYTADSSSLEEGTIVRSVDLQKVIMLPRLPGVKTVCFTKRIIAFHETFAPVNAYLSVAKNICVLWHEGLAGRRCEEITSVYVKALEIDRDYNEIVYFMDNCSAQNKNWSLITAIISIINSGKLQAQTITFKYLEAGHTFMSADTVHAGVERQMKAMKNVCDFNDFKECVSKVSKATVVIPVNADFKNFKGEQSQAKLKKDRPLLSDCRVLQFRKNSISVWVKKTHDQPSFQEFDFLKKSIH